MAPTPRDLVLPKLLAAAAADVRIVGVVEYGSGCQGRADALSDLDIVVVIRDAVFDDFKRDWKTWVAGLGKPLLTYISMTGGTWAVIDAGGFPLRVDLGLFKESVALAEMPTWPIGPVSAAAMVLLDKTGGELTRQATALVGRSAGPVDARDAFERTGGDFWYYLLRASAYLDRGQLWAARHNYQIIIDKLIGLLRLECGAVERWQTTAPSTNAENELPARYLVRLEACAAIGTAAELRRSLVTAAQLGREVSATLAHRRGWPWPSELADRITAMF